MTVVNVEEKEAAGQRIEEKGQRRYIRDGHNLNNKGHSRKVHK
jgi:hypothetical protein